ncbi:MAG: Smr/MutS family protein, partial [Lachnospiraceae bacterium]|nr:Smr/MutS family protein [Lachnospiraceae bacterium]
KTLIITGPNTGGKTVALKTVGLLSLMALSGMFINAKENSIISNFDEIFADIGDEQSIEQNLSTFSAHMKNIIYITKNTTSKSLVLFDEICTGTDPIEGANLAMSIITTLKNRNCRVFATTHYPELKLYALSQKGVVNGSFEFDVETLKPTYRLLIGLPGKSNAFLISEKLGLDKNIIDNAKNHIKENDKKFEDIVSSLQNKETHIDKEKKEIDALKEEIISLKQKVERQQKGLNDREESVIRQAKEKAMSILMDARNTANETIKNMKEEGATLDGSIKERTKINKMLSDISSSLMEKTKGPSKPISPKKIRIGQKVKIMSMGLEGTVESMPDKDYNLFVRVGLVRTSAKLSDLEMMNESHIQVENATIKHIKERNGQHIKIEKNMDTPMELNVIGKDKEEALFMLDKYLDDCLLGHLKTCRIIHGRGEGILKNAIHNYLRKLDYIAEYHLADYHDGGDGATIITFK